LFLFFFDSKRKWNGPTTHLCAVKGSDHRHHRSDSDGVVPQIPKHSEDWPRSTSPKD